MLVMDISPEERVQLRRGVFKALPSDDGLPDGVAVDVEGAEVVPRVVTATGTNRTFRTRQPTWEKADIVRQNPMWFYLGFCNGLSEAPEGGEAE